jgi:hypothetical protein
MASTYTTGFGIEKIGTGEQAGAWGTTTNHNADILDRIASYTAVALTGTTHTLTVREASPGSGTENLQDGMYRVIKFTGALGANNTVTIAPNTSPAWFIIENATTDSGSGGPYSVILTQGSGANVTVQNGKNAIIYCDGAGAGAVVYDALADLQVGTLEVTGAAAIDGVTTHGGNVVSDTDSTDDLGTTGVRWANLFVDGITATDQITATGFTGTLDGILGSGTPAAATVTTLTASGIASIDDTTDTTSGTTGSIHTDGGLGVAKSLHVATTAAIGATPSYPAEVLTLIGPDGENVIGAVADTLLTLSNAANCIMALNAEQSSKSAIYFGQTGASGNTYGRIEFDNTANDMSFWTNNLERMTIATAGEVTITDNLVFSTAAKGVYLGVTSATAANLLDDYEEGDFTPAFTYATAGDQSFAYGAQIGKYTKIGRMVHYGIQITTTTHTYSTAAGALTITGLPFASSGAINQPGSIQPFGGITDFLGGRTALGARPLAGNTSLTLTSYGSNLTSTALTIASTTTGTNLDLYISGSYLV